MSLSFKKLCEELLDSEDMVKGSVINKATNDFLKSADTELKARGFKSKITMKEGDSSEYQWVNENGDSVLLIIDKAVKVGEMNYVTDMYITSENDSVPKRVETLFVMPDKDGKAAGAGEVDSQTEMKEEEYRLYLKSIEEAKKLFTIFGSK